MKTAKMNRIDSNRAEEQRRKPFAQLRATIRANGFHAAAVARIGLLLCLALLMPRQVDAKANPAHAFPIAFSHRTAVLVSAVNTLAQFAHRPAVQRTLAFSKSLLPGTAPSLILLAALLAIILYQTHQMSGVRRNEAVQEELLRRVLDREEVLRERYRELLDQSSDIVYTHDVEGRLITWNKAGELITGYTAAEVLHRGLWEMAPETLRPGVQSWIEGLAKGGAKGPFELTLLAKDGHEAALDVSTRVITQNGIPVCILGFARDVTQRRLAETATRLAKEAAEAANRAKSEFLANTSHEIRTPLNGIIGMTGILLDSHLSAEQREYLGIVQMCSESLLKVIDDMLDYSKLEAGRVELEMAPFDFRAAVQSGLPAWAEKAREKGLTLTIELDRAIPARVFGDPNRLRQVLANLMGNAIKFTATGGVQMGAAMIATKPEAITVRFWVRDTGIGIPRERQQSIFEAFVQVDGSSTRKYGGTGLGLAISRQLVLLMKGELSLESQPGVGSEFSFVLDLPLVASQRGEAGQESYQAASVRAIEQIAPGMNTSARLRILLLDPMIEGPAPWILSLRNAGYVIEVAETSREALALIDKYGPAAFDLVLLDHDLAILDNYQTVAALHTRFERSGHRVPVVALAPKLATADLFGVGGIDACLAKPLQEIDLANLVRLASPQPGASSESSNDGKPALQV